MRTDPRSRPYGLILILLLAAATGLSACDSDPKEVVIDLDDRDTLIGTYRLVSVLDKAGDLVGVADLVFEGGTPRTVTITEDGETFEATVTINGGLTLTDETYQFDFSINIATEGLPSFTNTDEDEGTWSISGNILILDSDSPGEAPEQVDITASGNRITIETEETRFVFEQQ